MRQIGVQAKSKKCASNVGEREREKQGRREWGAGELREAAVNNPREDSGIFTGNDM